MLVFVPAVAGVFGLLIGSFLNVVIHRLPRGESVVWPGSRCPACARAIRAIENVPLLSWLCLRGRCRGCGAAISWRYPAVELATGALFVAIAWRLGPHAETALWLLFGAGLLAASVIDAEHRIIPDEISVGGLLLGLIALPLMRAMDGAPYVDALRVSFAGAILGGGLLWIVGFVHARISVALGRQFDHWPGEGAALPKPGELDYWVWFPGLGFGDVKLLAMIGAFVGPIGVLETILAASFLGLGAGLAVALVTRHLGTPFGFGPALAAGALAVALIPHAPWIPW